MIASALEQGDDFQEIADELTKRGLPRIRGGVWRWREVREILSLAAHDPETPTAACEALRLGPKRFRTLQRARAVAPLILPLRCIGCSYEEIAGELNRRRVPTPKGAPWRGSAVWKALACATGRRKKVQEGG